MQAVEYDPLDKEIDFSKYKKVDKKFDFTFREKVKIWIDTLFSDSKLNKKDFYDEVESNLKEFCEIP